MADTSFKHITPAMRKMIVFKFKLGVSMVELASQIEISILEVEHVIREFMVEWDKHYSQHLPR